LHTIPGSQNGYNHSGKFNVINFLNGVMGIANAQRTLGYLRIITEFISQPEWSNVVPVFGIMNEPSLTHIGRDQLSSFYLEAYTMMRDITGIGANKGPYMSIHDFGLSWAGFLSGSDRIALDTHPYVAFNGQANTATVDTGTGAAAGGTWPALACTEWGSMLNVSQTAFGVTLAGEFSNAINDCGLFVVAAGIPVTYGGNCDQWEDASTWDDGTKAGIQAWAMASMDAFQNWFFWTWKVPFSSST
jgi:aryl-phospho-beta-D-glucosidase BglC (GH1 family)